VTVRTSGIPLEKRLQGSTHLSKKKNTVIQLCLTESSNFSSTYKDEREFRFMKETNPTFTAAEQRGEWAARAFLSTDKEPRNGKRRNQRNRDQISLRWYEVTKSVFSGMATK
jgi:hypothetical protein